MEQSAKSVPGATYRFRNIGPVKDAELELGDLTIIAGRNNTGKTYIAYTLYGFIKMWKLHNAYHFLMERRFSDAQFPDIESISEKIIQEGRACLPLDKQALDRQRKEVIQEIARTFSKEMFSGVFSSQRQDFEGASLEINLNWDNVEHPLTGKVDTDKFSLSIEYDGKELRISLEKYDKKAAVYDLRSYISFIYVMFLHGGLFPPPFILSAERFGISLFYRELDFTKNQLVDVLQKLGDDKNRERISPYLFIDKATSRYAMPIKDNIDYTRSIPDRRGNISEIHDHKLFDHIKDMMDGYYRASGDEIRFISKSRGKGRSFNIPLHLASSSARGLSDFYFFLQHVAKKGNILIIDEPESHLDTANQIQLARLLARLVRAGLKVLITTHSDYLIKEFNNLVMLSKSFADKEAVVRKLNYHTDDFLSPDSIRAYVAEENSLTRCKVDEFGIDMPVFDKTIDEINSVANELESRVTDDAE